MDIAIIGTGNVGSALATKLSAAKHRVFLGVRDTNNFKGPHLLKLEGISVHSIEDAVKTANVLVVAIPAHVTDELANQIAPFVGDKVIIDATNAFKGGPEGFNSGFDALRDITKSAHVVKCFNSTPYENIINPNYPDGILDMFVAGNSQEGKQVAIQLAKDVGFENIFDVGGDEKVILVEDTAKMLISLIYGGYGRSLGIKILKK
jgi:8-hydroxy-5-deazaflavin:NADPH oxidoreductase